MIWQVLEVYAISVDMVALKADTVLPLAIN